MKKAMNIKKLALYGMLIALAMILSYIESLIPVLIPVPGIKLGLANLVVIICLYTLGGRAAIFVSIIRIFLIAFTFGNVAALMFAISGASLSLVCMLIAIKPDKFSTGGINYIKKCVNIFIFAILNDSRYSYRFANRYTCEFNYK